MLWYFGLFWPRKTRLPATRAKKTSCLQVLRIKQEKREMMWCVMSECTNEGRATPIYTIHWGWGDTSIGLHEPTFDWGRPWPFVHKKNKFIIPFLLIRMRWSLYQNCTSPKEESNAIIISIIWVVLRWNLALVANFNKIQHKNHLSHMQQCFSTDEQTFSAKVHIDDCCHELAHAFVFHWLYRDPSNLDPEVKASLMLDLIGQVRTFPFMKATFIPSYFKVDIDIRFFFRLGTYKTSWRGIVLHSSKWKETEPNHFIGYVELSPSMICIFVSLSTKFERTSL